MDITQAPSVVKRPNPSIASPISIDVELLMKVRLLVARAGEMDRYRWWNTKGMLSQVGELALSRGFSKSHIFARARVTFAVAAARSAEIFDPPNSITLWRLPIEIEDQFDRAWATWLDNPEPWSLFLQSVDESPNGVTVASFEDLKLISTKLAQRANHLRRADDLRSVPIKLDGESSSEAIALLAAAHSCSEPGKLAVPYMIAEEFAQCF